MNNKKLKDDYFLIRGNILEFSNKISYPPNNVTFGIIPPQKNH